ncbi:ribosome biogenesis GTPase Der, partial [Thermodesulfobacteriota bacterium]
MKPIIAIIGRPNVGKSTFFNRITRTKDALVASFPGVTRDRQYGDVKWEGVEFTLIDTGGFADKDEDIFADDVLAQIHMAMEDADVIIHMLDGKGGASPFDNDIIALLRNTEKTIFYVVNKIDGVEKEDGLYDFYSLGIETIYPVSAAHGYGVSDFLDDLVGALPKNLPEPFDNRVRIAVVGRPNVGKSSLINRILGKDRLIVSDIPGTTRDAIDSVYTLDEKQYLLIDTAGIRRKGKTAKKKLEKFSVIKALKSLDRCDVALIVIDADEGVTEQDITIAGYAFEKGCGCILLLNKWDLVHKTDKTVKQYYEQVRMAAKFLSFAPIMTISTRTGQRVTKVFKLVDDVYRQYTTRIGTGPLNKIISRAIEKNEPPFHGKRRIKFYYATQISSLPPTIVCFASYPEAIHFSYQRYLINQIRENTGLDQIPIRIIFRKRTGRA